MGKNLDYFQRSDLTRYAGEWVVICKEQVVAHGKDLQKVVALARQLYPEEIPFVDKVSDGKVWLY